VKPSHRTPAPETVQRLLLARLLVKVKKPLSRKRLQGDVAKAIAPPLSKADADAAAAAALEACVRAQYVELPAPAANKNKRATESGPPQLTASGRQALPQLFGVEHVPVVKDWAHGKQLAALAGSMKRRGATTKQLDADTLSAWILTHHYGLPAGIKTAAQAVDRLAWRALGVERDAPFDPSAVQRYLLREIVPENSRVNLDAWRRMLAMRALQGETHDANGLTRALLAQPLGSTVSLAQTQPEPVRNDNSGTQQASLSLGDFARAVTEAATRPEVARFHDDRAFIGSVWDCMRGHSPVGDMSLEQFKTTLIEAHRARLLHITRADLVSAMDPAEVERSEARYQDSTFHFVQLDAGGLR
jgi:hypothetical protein